MKLSYQRRKTIEVQIGDVFLGSDYPICTQSMINTNTLDTEASVKQSIEIIEAGGKLVRITTQGVREAENLKNIKTSLLKQGFVTPLVADIHFNPNAAETAALYVEKVRINPGNFVDKVKTFDFIEYTEVEYLQELEKIEKRLIPLLDICKKNNTAIRIGVNHGSLSDRIMSKYGDTPEGMVESCMEFLRICVKENFYKIILSIKASNTLVMVQTVRLLVQTMEKENMFFPLHLGVTEAGDGEDGRIKSAVGIGALLAEGLGDTIRVSLSEDPEKEIPIGEKMIQYVSSFAGHTPIDNFVAPNNQPHSYQRRKTYQVLNIGKEQAPVVIATEDAKGDLHPDYYLKDNKVIDALSRKEYSVLKMADVNTAYLSEELFFIKLTYKDLLEEFSADLLSFKNMVFLLHTSHQNPLLELRVFFAFLKEKNCKTPVLIYRSYQEDEEESLQIKSAIDTGPLFLDGYGDGIIIENKSENLSISTTQLAFSILQAARVRVSKTEYISCPGCGRTLFNLQTVIKEIKEKTSHLKGLKIGIMGCIVNGPGEMADADYGYVGAGKGKVSLYKKQECIEKNIDEKEAVEKLIELIKNNGDWIEKV